MSGAGGLRHKVFWVLPLIFIPFFIFLTNFQPAESGVQVIPQTVRVCIAQKVTDISFSVEGKYRLVDTYSGEVIGLPREGEEWRISLSGNRMKVFNGHEVMGDFSESVALEEIKHRVYIMSGNGSVVQKDAARELAVQGADGNITYLEGELSELWAQGKDSISSLKPAGGLNLIAIQAGPEQPRRAYRGSFEFRSTGDGLLVINQLDIEDYLYGVVPAEMPSRFPFEALKAQAVAARSYLISNFGHYASQGFDVLATQNSQVYKGYSAEHPVTSRAVDATRGEVMVFRGRTIPGFFHSCSGGFTENSEDVWSSVLPYIRSKPDPLDRSEENKKHYNWQVIYSQADLTGQLFARGYKLQEVTDLKILELTSSGKRVKRLLITGIGIDGSPTAAEVANADSVRKALGLKSAMFTMEKDVDEQGRLLRVTFTGNGWGHGLGMSQWGARGMAEQGYNYREILQYYYTGVSIVENYGL